MEKKSIFILEMVYLLLIVSLLIIEYIQLGELYLPTKGAIEIPISHLSEIIPQNRPFLIATMGIYISGVLSVIILLIKYLGISLYKFIPVIFNNSKFRKKSFYKLLFRIFGWFLFSLAWFYVSYTDYLKGMSLINQIAFIGPLVLGIIFTQSIKKDSEILIKSLLVVYLPFVFLLFVYLIRWSILLYPSYLVAISIPITEMVYYIRLNMKNSSSVIKK